jgi:hypothetical protein
MSIPTPITTSSEPYLPQLGLYGLALERAIGSRPSLALLFLRGNVLHPLKWDVVEAALMNARARVDAGAILDPSEPDYNVDDLD